MRVKPLQITDIDVPYHQKFNSIAEDTNATVPFQLLGLLEGIAEKSVSVSLYFLYFIGRTHTYRQNDCHNCPRRHRSTVSNVERQSTEKTP